MARLTNIWRDTLTQEDLDRYPIWTWDDRNEGLHPLSETEQAPDGYWPLFIKARFYASEHTFDGYLVGTHALGLFVNEEQFVLNLNMPDRIEGHLVEICRLLGCQPFKLFPLRYESPVRSKEGDPIAGTIAAPKGWKD
jgi:hypothetical protein